MPSDSERRLLASRAVRAAADGMVSVFLAAHLGRLGFSPRQVGAIVAGTLLGSAALVTALGAVAHRFELRRVLLAACVLMAATGAGFASLSSFLPLLVVAVVGTLNPSAGDVSVFLPVEQALLAGEATGPRRASVFATYNVVGTLAGALGALLGGFPERLSRLGLGTAGAIERAGFLLYAAVGVGAAVLYRKLPPAHARAESRAPLARSRGIVLRLAALFALDSFGGGFVVQALLVLWLQKRFALPLEVSGAIFFASGILGAFFQYLSGRIAARLGLIETMVFTHLPANIFLVLAGVVPSLPLAVAFLLLRAALSPMDVPARQAYVMAVVPPEERAAAASVTNVPRSLAAALPPLLAGWMLERSSFGWPLVVAGSLKATYDLLLLWQFRSVRPPADA